MKKSTRKILFPRTRLSDLIDQPGGVEGDDAVAEALRAVEALREDCVGAIEQTIAAIERVVSAQKDGKLSPEGMQEALTHADRIITLAGTYGYTQLDTAARSLCDLIAGLTQIGSCVAEPIVVHAKALRLLAPKAAPLPPAESERMLVELGKVVAYFKPADRPAAGGGS